ncbi:MAG: ligase [Anaerolineaceae bacterium]|nr:ligase [Anaerolineaceae bacterium]
MNKYWRIIYSLPSDGPTNMAIDEAILSSVSKGKSLPTLRLYSWSPACISLGRAQSDSDVDKTRLQSFGYDLVRRATGGRSILHLNEFTYSVCLPKKHPIASGGVLPTYRRISNGILASLTELGVVVDNSGGVPPTEMQGAVCFEHRSHYEISANGRKLLGSAQMRSGRGVLQHGSLPLKGDIASICDTLLFRSENDRATAVLRVRDQATVLADVLGYEASWEQVATAFERGFAQALDIDFSSEGLSAFEKQNVNLLIADKYANLAWTSGSRHMREVLTA